jgi:tetratricopeptide (TPR) repeat protein
VNIRLNLSAIAFSVVAMSPLAMAQFAPTGAVTTGNTYVPGVTYQSDNPNYLNRNPFYFEGRVDWNLLKITTPTTPWEYLQRGIHNQDDLEDYPAAIADYQKAISLNSLTNGTCQIIKTAAAGAPSTSLNPAPCMFTPRLRLAHLLIDDQPDVAIGLFKEVLAIDALRLGVNSFIGEAYEIMAKNAKDEKSKEAFLENAIEAFEAELALSPVTPQYTALTGDKANNEHVHWALAEIYAELGEKAQEAEELQLYLDASQWHSDTYPWRIQLAKARLAKLPRPNIRAPRRVASSAAAQN